MKQYLSMFMENLSISSDLRMVLTKGFQKIDNSEKRNCFYNLVSSYMNVCEKKVFFKEEHDTDMMLKKTLEDVKELAQEINLSYVFIQCLFCIACSKTLMEFYERKKLPISLFWYTMQDIPCKIQECYEIFQSYGMLSAWWYDGFFTLNRFQFHSLQFEKVPFSYKNEISIGNQVLHPNDQVINIHIPSHTSLKKEDRLRSYKEAYQFYKSEFLKEQIPFVCDSWLLYPKHKEGLSKTSNIVDFMNDFLIFSKKEDEECKNGWRVFKEEWVSYKKDPLYTLSETTSLKRLYKKWIQNKEKTGSGYGVFLFDENCKLTNT